MSTSLRIAIVFLLVLGNAVFVAAEYALVTGRRSRLEERAERGGRGAKTALRLMDDPVRFISTVQVGITIFAILLGAIGEPLLSELMEPPLSNAVAFLISFAILTYLSVVVGELVPKAVALQKAETPRGRARHPARLARADHVSARLAAREVCRTSSFGSSA